MSYHRLIVFHTAYIALGSNLGNREGSIGAALAALGQVEGIRVMQVSAFLDNPAVGGPVNSPPFLNAAAKLETAFNAVDLLHQLLAIEQRLGRHRGEKWGPRSIDLDLLLYGDQIIRSDDLVVPHPLMHQRRFVLEPLCEIAPDAIHPVFKKSISKLLFELRD